MKAKETYTSEFNCADSIEALAKEQEKMQLKKALSVEPEEFEKPTNLLPVFEFSNLSLKDKDDSSEEIEPTSIRPNNDKNEDEEEVCGNAEFDPSQLRPKGPERNSIRARQHTPYLKSNFPCHPTSQRTLINGRQMNGAQVLENETLLWVHCGNENIPTPVEEFESLQSTSGGETPDIEREVCNVAPNDFKNIMTIIELSSTQPSLFNELNVTETLTTPESSGFPSNSQFPSSPDSAYCSNSSGSPASGSSCPNESPNNSPNSSYHDWLPPVYHDEVDRFPQATFVDQESGSQDFEKDVFGNFTRNLVELQPQNIHELDTERPQSGYCGLPVTVIPATQDFASFNFTGSEECSLGESLLEYNKFPFEEVTTYQPNIPQNDEYLSLDLGSYTVPSNELSSPNRVSPIPSSDYGLSQTRGFAQVPSSPAMNIVSKPINEKKKSNITNHQRSSQQRDPPPILPTGTCQNNRRTKTKSLNLSLEQRLQLRMQPQRRMTIWKALVMSKEDLGMKNENNQTSLMQLLLRSPKPSGLIERVFIRVNMMKNDENADLLTCRDKFGHSALYQAATLHPDIPELAAYIAETYAVLGRNVNEVFNDGNTILHCLAELGEKYANVMDELLKLSANGNPLFITNACNAVGNTPLHIAAKNHLTSSAGSTYNIACILMKNGANVSIQNSYLETPLHVAATSKACEPNYFRKLLEQRGAENVQDAKGNTPLHLVALNVNVHNKADMKKVMEYLLTSAAKTDIKNVIGQTPIMNVHQHCIEEIKHLLTSKRQ